jgi:hypothetical protein
MSEVVEIAVERARAACAMFEDGVALMNKEARLIAVSATAYVALLISAVLTKGEFRENALLFEQVLVVLSAALSVIAIGLAYWIESAASRAALQAKSTVRMALELGEQDTADEWIKKLEGAWTSFPAEGLRQTSMIAFMLAVVAGVGAFGCYLLVGRTWTCI